MNLYYTVLWLFQIQYLPSIFPVSGTTDANCLASVESPTQSFTDEAIEDMFATLEKGEMPSVGNEPPQSSLVPTLDLDGEFNLSGITDFGEVFTDLSQILMVSSILILDLLLICPYSAMELLTYLA